MKERRPPGGRGRLVTAGLIGATLIVGAPAWAAADGLPLTTQDPASAQPSLPKPMPDLTVPTGQAGTNSVRSAAKRPHGSRRHARRQSIHARADGSLERPSLANVELTEPLPYPPQPPHVTVPVPAYPFEDLVLGLITPPPPVVCRPTRRSRFQPDPHLVDERPVLCTADNP